MKVPLAVTVAVCSSGLGYFIGKNGRNKTVFEDWCLPGTSFLYTTAFAKSSVPANVDKINSLPISLPPGDGKVNRVTELMKYGFPSMDNLRSYDDFILSYDKRNRNAHWVLEHLTPEKVKKSDVSRSNMKFTEDESVHVFHRATNKDFQGTGYDRGHLAAAANHRHSETAMTQTFLLSNISPQVGEGFNRNAWNDLEKYTRTVARRNQNVYVCTGPLFLPRVETDKKLYVKYEVIGHNHVAVPTHFFKVLLIEDEKGNFELQSFVMPNQKLPDVKLKHWLVPLETIERAAGLSLFNKIPKGRLKKINATNA